LVEEHIGIIPVKFGQNPMSGFRGEDVEVNKSLVSERDQCPEGALTPNLNVEDPVKKTTLL